MMGTPETKSGERWTRGMDCMGGRLWNVHISAMAFWMGRRADTQLAVKPYISGTFGCRKV